MKTVWIYGIRSATAALKNPSRNIYEARCTNDKVKSLVQGIRPNMRISMCDDHTLMKLTKGVHQGIALCCDALPIHKKIDKHLLATRVLVLDHLQDIGNIGSIMRSMVAMGFTSLITNQKGTPDLEQAGIKAACGALEYLNIFQVANVRNAIDELKKQGFWCVGLDHRANQNNLVGRHDKIALVVGSENDGIKNIVKQECDEMISLKTSKEFPILNAAIAAAIAMYVVSSG